MLGTTTINCCRATTIFKLEGKLLGPWISELQSVRSTAHLSTDHVRLDLQGLTFVDAEGARFLTSLIRDRARVIACSGFIAEILQLNKL